MKNKLLLFTEFLTHCGLVKPYGGMDLGRHWHQAVTWTMPYPWWRHQMETFSALLAICTGNSPVPGEFPTQRPVTRSFDVYFDLRPNKWLSKQSWGWWFETLSCSLWRHRNVISKVSRYSSINFTGDASAVNYYYSSKIFKSPRGQWVKKLFYDYRFCWSKIKLHLDFPTAACWMMELAICYPDVLIVWYLRFREDDGITYPCSYIRFLHTCHYYIRWRAYHMGHLLSSHPPSVELLHTIRYVAKRVLVALVVFSRCCAWLRSGLHKT